MKYSILSDLCRGTWLLAFLAVISPAPAGEGEGLVGTTEAAAEDRSLDKRACFLFHRTPSELRRDLAADRPDSTETPITVDAGWFQLESSFFDYGRDDDGGIREETFTYGAMNLKVGLLHHVDLQFVFDAHTVVRTEDATARTVETVEGFADPQLRLKVNLWGNDGGRTAFALFPFVKIPTGSELSNGHVEGGLILPLSIELNDRFSLGLMAEVDAVHDGAGYEAEFVHTAVLGIGVTDRIGAYLEYVGVAGSSAFAYEAVFSGGMTFAVSENVQFDVGGRVGLNDAAEDGGVFSGITLRF